MARARYLHSPQMPDCVRESEKQDFQERRIAGRGYRNGPVNETSRSTRQRLRVGIGARDPRLWELTFDCRAVTVPFDKAQAQRITSVTNDRAPVPVAIDKAASVDLEGLTPLVRLRRDAIDFHHPALGEPSK